MAIAKCLDDVDARFMQECPLCQRSNRIVMKGVFKVVDKTELHPDMGYSFCNCRAIFYTRKENVLNPAPKGPDENGIITKPDPFFAWPDPYQFYGWDVRRYEILWDMDSLCQKLEEDGYVVEWAMRDFNVHSKTPQCFHIKVKM